MKGAGSVRLQGRKARTSLGVGVTQRVQELTMKSDSVAKLIMFVTGYQIDARPRAQENSSAAQATEAEPEKEEPEEAER